MQVGNGEFAFGFDISGMQTFSDNANTMSNWGWYRFPLPQGQRPEDFRGAEWEAQGRMVRYDIPNPEQGALRDWMVRNPQRINLGRIGLVLIKDDGLAGRDRGFDRSVQRLDLWTGTATSRYSIDGREVVVTTVGHPEKDAVAVRIESEKVADRNGRHLVCGFLSRRTRNSAVPPIGTAPEGTLRSFRPGHIWPASTGSSTIRITMSTCSGTPGQCSAGRRSTVTN